jgi:nitroimidazol reductase NimA-like FMN-containing flavoprotein (pyridoxamine 5'-phosphate oxidase superfamily)
VELTSHLSPADRDRVEGRLRHNLMAWLTTVRPDGQPVSVPVWFLARDDGTILLYSQAGKSKLDNIVANPRVSLTADQPPAYVAKYLERSTHCSELPNGSLVYFQPS